MAAESQSSLSEDQPIVTNPEHELLDALRINKDKRISDTDMMFLSSRLESFEGANLRIKKTHLQLAEAGFYRDPCDDECICYYCGIGIDDWEPNDDPWVEHALRTYHCGFLNLKKSELKFKVEETLEKNQKDPLDIYLCKICQVNVANHVYMPCRHLVSCLECATTQNNCPICRADITGFLKIVI